MTRAVLTHWVWTTSGWASPTRLASQGALLIGSGAYDTVGSGEGPLTDLQILMSCRGAHKVLWHRWRAHSKPQAPQAFLELRYM